VQALLLSISPARFAVLQPFKMLSETFCYRGPLSVLKLAEIPDPKLPSPEWVIIKTRLCGFCGSDLNLIFLRDSPTAMPFTSFPCVPGHEFCGEIIEAGSDAKNWKSGEFVVVSPGLNCDTRGISPACRACAMGRPGNCENFAEGSLSPGLFTGICKDVGGGFAEYTVAHKSQLFRIPEGVTQESAVLNEPLAVGLQAVLDNMPASGEKVLIIGGGVIGAMVVKSIRALGPMCDITVAEPSPFAAAYVMESGADRTVTGDLIDAAAEITGARSYKPMLRARIPMGGFDRVYDTVGHQKTVNASMRVLAAGGTLSLIGIGNDIRLDMTPLWLKIQTIKGCYGYGFNKTQSGERHAFEIALDLIDKKKVRVDDMLTHTFALSEYQKMIGVNIMKAKNRAIKTAVSFT
jgi:(R,R)-butanediol dehydrogenase / meso-butanediol dehydrogenase / diacetyl reductase